MTARLASACSNTGSASMKTPHVRRHGSGQTGESRKIDQGDQTPWVNRSFSD